MLTAVELDDQAVRVANEIDGEAEYRFLTTELHALDLTGAEAVPEAFLDLGRVPTQFASPSGRSGRRPALCLKKSDLFERPRSTATGAVPSSGPASSPRGRRRPPIS